MLDREAIAIVIRMISLQFEKQGLLDPSELDSGNWRFVSFPASLHARSWLEVMRDPRGNWYPEGWWTDSSNEEDQRRILHEMEERRIGSRNVEPIRWVHVSWASSRSMTEFSCVPERIEKGWMSLFMFFQEEG